MVFLSLSLYLVHKIAARTHFEIVRSDAVHKAVLADVYDLGVEYIAIGDSEKYATEFLFNRRKSPEGWCWCGEKIFDQIDSLGLARCQHTLSGLRQLRAEESQTTWMSAGEIVPKFPRLLFGSFGLLCDLGIKVRDGTGGEESFNGQSEEHHMQRRCFASILKQRGDIKNVRLTSRKVFDTENSFDIRDAHPCPLIGSRSLNAGIKGLTALSVSSIRCHPVLFQRSIHSFSEPVNVVDGSPDLIGGVGPTTLHFLESSTHDIKLSTVYAKRPHSDDYQSPIEQQRQNLEEFEFPLKFRGWAFVVCGLIFGWVGNFSLFYSGFDRWGWRKRIALGIPAWSLAIYLAIHGFNLILALPVSSYHALVAL